MKKLYFIENMGCDATTYGIIELDENEFKKFCSFVYNLNKNAYFSCMPIINIYEGNWEVLREVTAEDLLLDTLDDNYIDRDNRLWLNKKCYTFKDKYDVFFNYPKINLERICNNE